MHEIQEGSFFMQIIMTGSMEKGYEGNRLRRRNLQIAYNTKHGITPTTIIKAINDITDQIKAEHEKAVKLLLLSGRENVLPKSEETD